MPNVVFQDLGLIDYKEAWDYQEKRFNEILDVKKNNRKENRQDPTLSKLKFSVSLSSESSGTLVIRIMMMSMRGMCKTKLNRQLRYCITMPPSVGPKASPKYTAARVIPIAFPRSFAG